MHLSIYEELLSSKFFQFPLHRKTKTNSISIAFIWLFSFLKEFLRIRQQDFLLEKEQDQAVILNSFKLGM